MRIHDQEVNFSVFKTMQLPNIAEECFFVDVVDRVADMATHEVFL